MVGCYEPHSFSTVILKSCCDVSGSCYSANLTIKIYCKFFSKALCKEHNENSSSQKKIVRLVCVRPAEEAETCVICCSIRVEKNIWFLEVFSSELGTEHWILTASMSSPYIKLGTSLIQEKITLLAQINSRELKCWWLSMCMQWPSFVSKRMKKKKNCN